MILACLVVCKIIVKGILIDEKYKGNSSIAQTAKQYYTDI